MTQAAFTLDLNRCTGCGACVVACNNENRPALPWRNIQTFNPARHPAAATFHVSMACNHCADPACMAGCPAAAYSKDPHTGAVLLDRDRCIGCRYCAWVCPYGAPQFNRTAGVMEKCTFCSHRLSEDREPACAEACPVEALGFRPEAEPGALDHPGLPEVGLRPSLHLTPRRAGIGAPPMTAAGAAPALAAPGAPAGWERLRAEGPLLAFTWLAALLAGFALSAWLGGPGLPAWGTLLLGGAAMAVSTAHLGRPERAWRAVRNLRHSWLSREILCFGLLVGTAGVLGWLLPGDPRVRAAAGVLGIATAFCVDMVYDVPGTAVRSVPHSANVTLTAIYLAGILAPLLPLAAAAGALKLALYLLRLRSAEVAPWVSALRLAAGFAVPLILLPAGAPRAWIVAAVLLAEAVDRAQFYAELEFLSPRRQLQEDLHRLTATPTP